MESSRLHQVVWLGFAAFASACGKEPEVVFADQRGLNSWTPSEDYNTCLEQAHEQHLELLSKECADGTYCEPYPPRGAACPEGERYTALQAGELTNYVPVECENPPDGLVWPCLSMRCAIDTPPCVDSGVGLSPEGYHRSPRSAEDLPILLTAGHGSWGDTGTGGAGGGGPTEARRLANLPVCAPVGHVIGTFDCGEVPVGSGGPIEPGVYGLTKMIQFGRPRFEISGMTFRQVLYVTPTSMLSWSDMGWAPTPLTYTTEDTKIRFAHVDGFDLSEGPGWTPEATYTATPNTLDIYSAVHGYWASFQRIEQTVP